MTAALLSNTLVSLFGSLGVIASIGLAGLLLYAISRTGSSHIVMFRLWRLASGGEKVQDERIRAFLQQQHALMSFRFVTGLRVRRSQEAHALIEWMEDKQLDVEQLAQAGRYFDPDEKTVLLARLPARWRLQALKLATLLCGLLTVPCMAGMLYLDSAVVQFKASGTYFMLSTESAQRFPASSYTSLQRTDCRPSASTVSRTGFDATEVVLLCAAFQQPTGKKYIDDTLRSQRLVLAMLIGLFGGGAFLLGRAVERALRAERLAKRLQSGDIADPSSVTLQLLPLK